MIDLFKYLKEIFNAIIEDDLMEYDFITLAIVIKISSKYRNKNSLVEIEKALKNKNLISQDKYKSYKMNKALMIEIEKLIKE